ncbi:MAG: toll/interleukin-1 receptor domain-containing protein [Pseudomonadota bacterium]
MAYEARKTRVFLSYAQESQEFRHSVALLANWLRDHGLDVESDHKFANRPPEQGWPTWMQHGVEDADVVLVICTPRYRALFERRPTPQGGGYGATWESAILTADLYQRRLHNRKIFPVLPDGGTVSDIPTVLQGYHNGYRFPSGNERILALVEDAAAQRPATMEDGADAESGTATGAQSGADSSGDGTYASMAWGTRLALTFLWWIVCGVVPLACLQIDFASDGVFLAQLYPHFFLYPVLIGFFIVVCLLPSLHLLKHFLGFRRFALITVVVGMLSVYGTLADVSAGDPALWEFKDARSVQISSPKGTRNLIDEAKDVHRSCPYEGFSKVAKDPACEERRTALKEKAKELSSSGAERSLTHRAYVVSLFLQLVTLVMAVVCVGSFVVYRARIRGDLYSTDKTIAFTFFFYFLWVPLRIFALEQKSSIYGGFTPVSELPITLIIIGCYFYSIRLTWTVSRDYTIHFMQMVSALTLLYCAFNYPELLARIFGTASTPFTYPLVSIVLLLLLAPWLMFIESGKRKSLPLD